MTSLALRVAPPRLFGRRAALLVERNVLVYRHAWVVFLSGFFEPVFYLFSLGVGLGTLVHAVQVDGRSVSYGAFVAPALLASSAMNGAIFDAVYNIFFKLKYAKLYDSVLATPLAPRDVALGETVWSLMRGGSYSAGFLVVMLAMGFIHSGWAVLALPATLLIGFAFAAVGMAATTYMRSWQDFEWVTLAQLPMFLFSATFYPLSTYPPLLQAVVRATPFYQGVSLMRGLTTGAVGLDLLVNAAYLAGLGMVGVMVASRRLGRLLLT